MKYFLLIIAVFTLAACNESDNSGSNVSEQPDIALEEKVETALETAGLIPESETFTLSAPNSDKLPKELFVPQLN
ncbi:hypothetical protein [Colwellia sp. E2M01]|uniref:hypothetical protein n=1 Tax=Colwellia sp. E2M01 TaxID=2841561 RepID=UPI001C084D50|nr:hypothetical protein [Colwellia sp. E2M01]MBU2869910.1 hypothetical protein [Colwellia sp. E2M01]